MEQENQETNPASQDIEVETTKIVKGKITFLGKGFWKQDPPALLAMITRSLRYFAVGLITMVSGSDLFSGKQAKIINFGLGVFVLAMGAIDVAVGVDPDVKKDLKKTAVVILFICLLLL